MNARYSEFMSILTEGLERIHDMKYHECLQTTYPAGSWTAGHRDERNEGVLLEDGMIRSHGMWIRRDQ
jgi:hypothetical protein